MTRLRKIPFDDLIGQTTRSAVHLEMRDAYNPDDPLFADWRAGRPVAELVAEMRGWFDLVRTHVPRGVQFRRARIVSEPLADFIRFEWQLTAGLNVAAGEDVRWLPRRNASDLCLPGNDFWVFDDRLVRFGHFSGVGAILGHELSDDPAVVKLCASSFEGVWERATDHAEYRPD